jgi:DNA-binding response OmpR family regulator
MKSILLIDAETVVASGLQRTLDRFGFNVTRVDSAYDAHNWIDRGQFDIILVDFDLMPRGDQAPQVPGQFSESISWSGTGLVREFRAARVTTPIIIYTFLEGEPYETASLDAGADDYILKSKPLSVLLCRLHAHIRRHERDLGLATGSDRRVAIGRYTLDRDTGILQAEEKPIGLTLREIKLLEKLAANPLRIVTTNELLDDVWGNDLRRSPDAVAACIKRLRIKMEKNGLCDPIESVRGRGFRLSASVWRKANQPKS